MEDEEIEDDVVSELPEYSVKSEFSKAGIVSQATITCSQARANEMKEGYYNTKITKDGTPIRIWVPDARDKFIGSVNALLFLLAPEIKRDKKAQKDVSIFEEACDELKEKYIYNEMILDCNNGQMVYKKTGRKYMPIVDARVVIEVLDPRTRKKIGAEVIGGWNNNVNAYKNELVEVYDWFVARLQELIDRCDYFKMSASF